MTREQVFAILYADTEAAPPPPAYRQRAWGHIWCILKTLEMVINRPPDNDPGDYTDPATWTTHIWPEGYHWGTAGDTPDAYPLITYTVEWQSDYPYLVSREEDHGVAWFTFTIASREANTMSAAWQRLEALISAIDEEFRDRVTERSVSHGTGEGPGGLEGRLTLTVAIKA